MEQKTAKNPKFRPLDGWYPKRKNPIKSTPQGVIIPDHYHNFHLANLNSTNIGGNADVWFKPTEIPPNQWTQSEISVRSIDLKIVMYSVDDQTRPRIVPEPGGGIVLKVKEHESDTREFFAQQDVHWHRHEPHALYVPTHKSLVSGEVEGETDFNDYNITAQLSGPEPPTDPDDHVAQPFWTQVRGDKLDPDSPAQKIDTQFAGAPGDAGVPIKTTTKEHEISMDRGWLNVEHGETMQVRVIVLWDPQAWVPFGQNIPTLELFQKNPGQGVLADKMNAHLNPHAISQVHVLHDQVYYHEKFKGGRQVFRKRLYFKTNYKMRQRIEGPSFQVQGNLYMGFIVHENNPALFGEGPDAIYTCNRIKWVSI